VAVVAGVVLSGMRAPKDTVYAWQSSGRIRCWQRAYSTARRAGAKCASSASEKTTAISSTASSGRINSAKCPAPEWLAEVMFQPEVAETGPFFGSIIRT